MDLTPYQIVSIGLFTLIDGWVILALLWVVCALLLMNLLYSFSR